MFKTSIFVLAALTAMPAFSADPFTDAVEHAYAPYRAALFKTNSNSRLEAQDAIDKAQAAWNSIVSRFAGQPPAPYSRDPDFAQSLAEVSKVYETAAMQTGKGELGPAHETLEQVRDILAGLRQRNQVIVFTDHMNAYHARMEVLLSEGEKTLASPVGRQKLTEELGALAYLAGKLGSEAPRELAADPEFTALYQALQQSISNLRAALYHGDEATVKSALGKLKAPYSRLFLKFG